MQEVLEHISDMKSPSPMMLQYWEVKKQYPDHILFYRLGDFYEMFFEDAMVAHRVAELTLTGRDCGDGKRAAMCGVPFHKSEAYLGRLVSAGYKVAVCEQLEDPSQAKGLVRRDVIRVVTPGTITDEGLLSDRAHNYLGAICYGTNGVGLGFCDISTGQIYVTEIAGEARDARLCNELSIYMPSEILLNVSADTLGDVVGFASARLGSMITASKDRLFDEADAVGRIDECFGEDAEKLTTSLLRRTVGGLLSYIVDTQKTSTTYIKELNVYTDGQYMQIDASTRRNLELTESMRSKEKKGTLLWVLDRTETCLGARLLRSWIAKPLIHPAGILRRQEAVNEFFENYVLREELRNLFSRIMDLERLTAKVVYGNANAKDLRAIAQSVAPLPAVRQLVLGAKCRVVQEIGEEMDILDDIHALLDAALVDTPPFSVREGGMIRPGYNRDVDYLRSVSDGAEEMLREIEAREKESTGIKTLRVAYNKVFGFFIEVTKSQTSLVPHHYIRKQTLTNCERYITQELKELESTVIGAAERLANLEYTIFQSLCEEVKRVASRIQVAATDIACLDVYMSLGDVAVKNGYCRPEIDLSDTIDIQDGRHPVVERFVSDAYFVPNDTHLDTGAHRLMLITGPNMAGKSTYMRQVALMVIMAQIGSFVPAREARIGIADKVFTRVGASDDLALGQSTFMLEMTEVAYILNNATRHSLLIYDEVGRGTSTYDGMSIARAVVEYSAGKKLSARTLFATHYHELTAMEGVVDGVINYHIAAKKRGDTITFLRKIVRGGTDDSYGIEVAKLAGVPAEVIRRAKEILGEIEEGIHPTSVSHKSSPKQEESMRMDLFSGLREHEADAVADKLRESDLNTLTPIEAMNLLFTLKKMLSD